MTATVDRCVLPLSIRVVSRRLHDLRTVRQGMRIVFVHVFDSHMHRMAHVVRRIGLRNRAPVAQNDCTIAKEELDAMGTYPQTLSEAKGVA